MKKQKILFLTGLWVSILSFLGFPRNIKSTLFVATGFFLIFFSYYFNKKENQDVSSVEPKQDSMPPFIDNIQNN